MRSILLNPWLGSTSLTERSRGELILPPFVGVACPKDLGGLRGINGAIIYRLDKTVLAAARVRSISSSV